MKFRKIIALSALVAMTACTTGDVSKTTAWNPVEPAAMNDQQLQQKTAAEAARDELFQTLMARLSSVVQADGPAAAIAVCKDEAPEIARQVSQTHGVAIGRTSFKLRNPNNTPPAWAEPLIADRTSEPRYLQMQDGTLTAFLPIHLKAQCVTCHGTQEQIPPAVQERLNALYVDDEATGFKEGDLRGWFWVEVPPAS